jgi:hypothetical protein
MSTNRAGLAKPLIAAVTLVVAATQPWRLLAQAPEPAKGVRFAQISQTDLKDWLTYLASDALQGRQIYTEGYGLAAAYVADHLKSWGVKPLGDNGTYFQTVKVNGYKVTRNSSITLTVNGQTRTFKHGDHVTFAPNSGGKQTVTFDAVEFVGHGQTTDYQGRDVKNKLVVWLPRSAQGAQGGRGAAGPAGGRGGNGSSAAVSTLGAKAVISFVAAPAPPTAAEEALTKAQAALDLARDAVAQARQTVQGRGGRGAPAGGRGAAAPADFTSVQRVDNPIPPQLTGDEAFFDFLFTGAVPSFQEMRGKVEKNEALSPVTLNVAGSITIDNTFEVVSTQMTKNVAGLIEGSDPKLKDTYVMFGAHLDHVGYRAAGGGRGGGQGSCRRTQETVAQTDGQAAASGRGRGAPPPAPAAPAIPLEQQDVISNGADDDGSGSVAIMAVAKAFATGPKPRRSIVVMWFAGEESGLLGSRYDADHPVVPLDKIQALLNTDMIGRDDCDNTRGDYSNSVFVVGADRISTDLHNLLVDVNTSRPQPLTLDFELNDANDPESIYTRSDHYSYASKGIPIAFFTTGLHRDYHQVSDSVEKILFPKLARVAQLVYETGFSVANTERILERDNKGPRSGRGFSGRIQK